MLLTDGNFGRTLPTGSASGKWSEKETERDIDDEGAVTYLKTRAGYPCAEQRRVTEPSMVVRKLLESSMVGNFGLTLPTGSDCTIKRQRSLSKYRTDSLFYFCQPLASLIGVNRRVQKKCPELIQSPIYHIFSPTSQ